MILLFICYGVLSLLSYLWIKKDRLKKADIIIVLSGPNQFFTQQRIRKAAGLYRKKYSSSIIVSGKDLASWMKTELIHQGVQEKSILVQNHSTNTLEDALYSLPLVHDKKDLILVTTNVHQRRANMTFKKVFQKNLINIPSTDFLLHFLSPLGWLITGIEMIKYLKYKNQDITDKQIFNKL